MRIARLSAAIFLCVALVISFASRANVPGELVIEIIDVGQGDSALVISPEGKAMLIDAGEMWSVAAVFKALNAHDIDTIDYLVATHPHKDHIDGLIDVLEAYKVKAFVETGRSVNVNPYQSLLLEVKKRNIPVITAREGMSLPLGDVSISVLSPGEKLPEDIDDCSLVLHLSYGKFSALFVGDIGKAIEQDLVSRDAISPITLLKVAHHGSLTSSTEAFINRALPKYAVISVGKDNSYGHPSAFVLMRLGIVGATVFRTDVHGTVTFTTDGHATRFTTEKNEVQVKQTYSPPQFLYVASKNSDVFHYSTCSSVQTIKQSNLIKFDSRGAAIASGRRPCSICRP